MPKFKLPTHLIGPNGAGTRSLRLDVVILWSASTGSRRMTPPAAKWRISSIVGMLATAANR
jgi:hypothetical protein